MRANRFRTWVAVRVKRGVRRFREGKTALDLVIEGVCVAGALALVAMSAGMALADQETRVKPDGVVTGFVSTTEQTRVHIVGDRIRRMLAPPQGFEAINDAQTGDVFLNPLPVEHGAQIAATFVITEKGHTVQLRLKPMSKPAEQVMITIDDGVQPVPVASRTVRNAPHVDELVTFIGYVIRGEQPAGVEVTSGLRNPFNAGRKVEAEWTGSRFVAEVLRVVAEEGPVALSENQFLETGVAAIWISDRHLAQGEVARVIVVKLRG